MKDGGMDERVFEQLVREAAVAATALPAPEEAWKRITARACAGEVVLLPVEARRAVITPDRKAIRAAVMLLAVCGAAAAAVLPASPVRQWLDAAFSGSSSAESEPPAPTPGDGTPSPPQPLSETWLMLEPADGGIVVSLDRPQQDVRLLVRFVASGEPEVRATGAAASARFRSATGRLTVSNASGGGIVLTIPRTMSRVRVEVDGEPYLTKENGRIEVLAPAADTAGSEILLQIRR
jgi:hypothetical protein